MVVYHHFILTFCLNPTELSLTMMFCKYGGTFGVNIFFILSGFVMCVSATREGQTLVFFIWRRLIRVIPNYWIYTFLTLVCVCLFPSAFFYTDWTLRSLIASLLFIPHANPSSLGVYPLLTVGWSLCFEMFFYAWLSVSLFSRWKYAVEVHLLLLFCLSSFWPRDFVGGYIMNARMVFPFVAGAVLATRHIRSSVVRLAIALCVAANMESTEVALEVALATIVVWLAVLLDPYIPRSSKVVDCLIRLGEESYSTYLCHTLVFGIMFGFIGGLWSPIESLLLALVASVPVLVVSKWSYRVIENSPRVKSWDLRVTRVLNRSP
jgi:exopolysaccharide production protein ExoZ